MEINKEQKQEINKILEILKIFNFDELDEFSFHNIATDFRKRYGYEKCKSNSGATKGVLIFKDLGFVIKIPFTYCEECELCGAIEGEEDWNYCSQEVNRYKKAAAAGFEDIFLETAYLDDINGYPIYIQEYADIINNIENDEYINNHCSSTNDDKDYVRCIDNEEYYEHLDAGWEADLYVRYGIEKFKNFKEYLRDNCIDDLYNSNIGYIGKRPVLVDYAGFEN